MPHSDGAYTAVLHARRHLKAIWPEPWAKNNKGLEQLVLMVARRVVREASLEEKTAMEERLPAWMTKDTLEQWMVLRQAPEKAAPATPVASPAPLVDSPSPAAEGTPEKVVQFGKLRRIALAKYVCLNRQRLKRFGKLMRAAATNRRSSGWRPTKGIGHGKGRVSVASGRASTS